MAYGAMLVDEVQSSVVNAPPVFKDGNGAQIGTLCRAWVNFNGSGTPVIRGAFNVSSITRGGTGNYRVNFTKPMPDNSYTMVCSGHGGNAASAYDVNTSFNPDGANVMIYYNGAWVDVAYVGVTIFR